MKNVILYGQDEAGLSPEEIRESLILALSEYKGSGKKILLAVPDFTRFHSNAGLIANIIYHELSDSCQVDLLPALGTHVPMTRSECAKMYGDIPYDKFIEHNWRTGVVKLGQVPADFVKEVSEGVMDTAIDVEVNEHIVQGNYDLIVSIGQVVPHEVVGMANHSKNILVGCGGSNMINSSHILGAFYGMERIMGRDHSPVRKVFDYAAEHYLKDLHITYILTVTTAVQDSISTHGLFIGSDRSAFEKAVALSQEKNIISLDDALNKVVVYLDPEEFKSTWLANKAIYRTRMVIADGGELIVLAPGVDKCGEDAAVDSLIREYGYCGRERVIQLCRTEAALQRNLSAAAHLIHGSSDDRFKITYCTRKLTKEEVESVNFSYLPYDEAIKKYDPDKLKDGFNTVDGEEIYYISNPALGLWSTKEKYTE
ncbi:MAG: DUF2088 domain-containing protein [Fastidiosipila sp.]|nr:DUF2088 domain-containing protein [Fastidiosipila sp.]